MDKDFRAVRNVYQVAIKAWGLVKFKRVSDGWKFRKKPYGPKLGILSVHPEIVTEEFIRVINEETDLYFVDVTEEFETGRILFKFEGDILPEQMEGCCIQYISMEPDGTIRR